MSGFNGNCPECKGTGSVHVTGYREAASSGSSAPNSFDKEAAELAEAKRAARRKMMIKIAKWIGHAAWISSLCLFTVGGLRKCERDAERDHAERVAREAKQGYVTVLYTPNGDAARCWVTKFKLEVAGSVALIWIADTNDYGWAAEKLGADPQKCVR